MVPIDRPLRLGDVVVETVRLYGERVAAALGIGAVAAATFALAAVVVDAVAIAVLAVAFTACYAAAARVAAGDAFGEAWAQVVLRAPALLVLTIVVAVPFALGILVRAADLLAQLIFLFFALSWLVFTGFAIPATMLERDPEARSWLFALAHALRRSLALARAAFLHAVAVAAVLVLVYALLGPLLASALVGFGESGRLVSFLLSQVVVAPFFFLGLAVLYFEQTARALSSRGG